MYNHFPKLQILQNICETTSGCFTDSMNATLTSPLVKYCSVENNSFNWVKKCNKVEHALHKKLVTKKF